MFLLAATLQLSLPGCEAESPEKVIRTAKRLPAREREAFVRARIARACPVVLTDAELERAAQYVLAHAADLEALWLAGRLDRMDAEARICRSMK